VHGGRIWLDSAEGGTRVRFTLPRAGSSAPGWSSPLSLRPAPEGLGKPATGVR